MTIKQIEIIRLALDTPEDNKHYEKHCVDAKLILNLFKDKLEGDIERGFDDVAEEKTERYWDTTDYLRNLMVDTPLVITEVEPKAKPVFLGRISTDTTVEEYLELLEDFTEDLPAYTVKFVWNDSKETVFEIIK
jgi:hypothetical protein